MRRNNPEQELQRACVQYLKVHEKSPLFFHPPNGGWRSKIEAAIFKGLGVRPGVPDLIVLEQNETHAGLFVELKWGKNRMTQAQIWWQEELVKRGYRHECIYSFDDFRKLIDEYLSDV